MAQGGPAAAAAFGYEGKRCPSWRGLSKSQSASSAALAGATFASYSDLRQ